ncbi:MAG: hypothetical protein K8R35_06110 [Bacteroidales bacterium]|nr:hypothetical protein [Bacteroidales bacterium]
MEIAKEILLVTIPALLVLITTYIIIRKMVENDRDKRRSEIILQNSSTITPIRLQAYERLTLFLERISIEALIMRTNKAGLTTKELQAAILSSIRSEFDHNLSQQIYITPQAWEVLKNAKTNTIKIVNTSAEKIPPNATGSDFSKYLLEALMEIDKEPSRVAIDFLKSEVARMM